jgi:hypothetical protein
MKGAGGLQSCDCEIECEVVTLCAGGFDKS